MQWFANLTSAVADPAGWASDREAEGYDGVACSDHFWVERHHVTPFPHLWVTLATMAAATERAVLQPAFANNLFRHPVEFAQASLSMQVVSGGRFEAGLGAGWARDEMERTGQVFPDGRTRARMFHEAVQIVCELVAGRPCRFEGEHYQVDVPALGPLPASPPPVTASVGSPWTMRHITPLVDRVELKMGRSTRGGGLDLAALASVTRDEVREMVDTVKSANPDVKVSMLVFVACGAEAAPMSRVLGDGLYGTMVGEPARIAEHLRSLADLGIDRAQVSQWVPGSMTAVAPPPHPLTRPTDP
jgi:alkanesulfonate monooxygenase SsuD/methylene tetrahydromethanopterin reductase-like flavin-dependent oxidoreductase (luciferase family)